ncbi:hypothetical protein BIW11_02542 [Tropilaelaps mercedesae]|uniref:60S ribosomal protein L41 n=1 Tax=Tropilaelaps mercedesae TaxID=418985 RepID=A0A1V9Y1G4_9ACAR|nr:hypothetical protein BIW11_02542 [Tropilaelaps mercedesae]
MRAKWRKKRMRRLKRKRRKMREREVRVNPGTVSEWKGDSKEQAMADFLEQMGKPLVTEISFTTSALTRQQPFHRVVYQHTDRQTTGPESSVSRSNGSAAGEMHKPLTPKGHCLVTEDHPQLRCLGKSDVT